MDKLERKLIALDRNRRGDGGSDSGGGFLAVVKTMIGIWEIVVGMAVEATDAFN
jgi:hypothetical protein